MLRIRALAAMLSVAAVPALGACPSEEEMARVGATIVAGRLMDPLPGLSLSDAVCARERLLPHLRNAWGPIVGYKAGLTSRALQQRFGLAEPVHGAIFGIAVSIRDGEEVPARVGEETVLSVEPDLLVRVRDEGINDAGADRVAILRHLDQVIPYIEMPAVGIRGMPDAFTLVAINVAARLGVVGQPFEPPATEEFARRLATMTVVMTDDGSETARAPGSALLGHPLDVIPWLVADLARQGRRLRAGDYISLGGFAPPAPAQPGHTYAMRYEGLLPAPVSVSVRIRRE
jgi:2-keto-4-pentenoate hydratase